MPTNQTLVFSNYFLPHGKDLTTNLLNIGTVKWLSGKPFSNPSILCQNILAFDPFFLI